MIKPINNKQYTQTKVWSVEIFLLMKEFSEFSLYFLLNSNCEFKHVHSRIQSEHSSHGNKCELTGDLYTYTEMGNFYKAGWGNLSNNHDLYE